MIILEILTKTSGSKKFKIIIDVCLLMKAKSISFRDFKLQNYLDYFMLCYWLQEHCKLKEGFEKLT